MSRRRPVRAAAVLLVLAAPLLGWSTPVSADGGASGGSQATQQPPSQDTGTTTQHAGNCVIYHNTAHFGKDCTDDSGRGVPVRNLYPPGTTDFDLCTWKRADQTTEAIYQANPALPHPGHAWIKTCVTGINPDLTAYHQQNLQETNTTVWVPVDQEQQTTTPPPGQPALWRALVGQYPIPDLEFGPSGQPRVNIPTYIAVAPATQQSAKIGVVGVDTGQGYDENVTMWAQVQSVDVQPGPALAFKPVGMPSSAVTTDGAGNPTTVTCSGTVAWQTGWSDASLDQPPPGACDVAYTAGSVDQTDSQYAVVVTANYVVHYTVGNGPVQTMPGFVTRTATRQIPVNEIQALNR